MKLSLPTLTTEGDSVTPSHQLDLLTRPLRSTRDWPLLIQFSPPPFSKTKEPAWLFSSAPADPLLIAAYLSDHYLTLLMDRGSVILSPDNSLDLYPTLEDTYDEPNPLASTSLQESDRPFGLLPAILRLYSTH